MKLRKASKQQYKDRARDQNKTKKKGLVRWQKWEASISVYTPPPPPISEKNHEEKEWKNIEIGRKK